MTFYSCCFGCIYLESIWFCQGHTRYVYTLTLFHPLCFPSLSNICLLLSVICWRYNFIGWVCRICVNVGRSLIFICASVHLSFSIYHTIWACGMCFFPDVSANSLHKFNKLKTWKLKFEVKQVCVCHLMGFYYISCSWWIACGATCVHIIRPLY